MREFVVKLRLFGRWLVGSGLKEDFLVEPPRGFRSYTVLLSVLAVAAVVAVALNPVGGASLAAAPLLFVVLLGVAVFFGDIVGSQGRENGVVVTFSGLFVLSSVAVFGPDWRLIVAVCLGRVLGLARSMPLGAAGASIWGFNLASLALQTVAAGVVFHAIAAHMALAPAIAIAAAVDFGVMLSLMLGIGYLEGAVRHMAMANLKNDGLYLLFNIPLLYMGTVALGVAPYWGVAALFGPVLLGLISTRSGEKLVLTERLLGVDGMTGLRNRMQFWADLDTLVRDSDRDATTLAAIMLDIDNFKILNDTHGHLEGDRALCAVADAIASSSRSTDFAARYGGEEFGVLLPDTSEELAMQVAERMRENCRLALEPWGTTVSIGVAVRDAEGLAGKPFIGTADSALYRAKHSGKNRVVLAAAEELATANFLSSPTGAPPTDDAAPEESAA